MAHRAKHRQRALLERAAAGVVIKSDRRIIFGGFSQEYRAAQETVAETDAELKELRTLAQNYIVALKDGKPRKRRETRHLMVEGYLKGLW